jgi:AraC family transcriptional regulator
LAGPQSPPNYVVTKTPVTVPQNVELTLAVVGNDKGLVIRTGAGQRQETQPSTGVFFCVTPVGVDNQLTIKAPVPRALHLYLPTTQFRKLADDFNLPGAAAHSIRYVAGIRDDVIEQSGRSLLSELTNKASAGRMYVETASLTLAARLLQKYCDSGTCNSVEPATHRIDQARLRGILAHISAHLDEEITLAQLAQVAGLRCPILRAPSSVQWASHPAAISAECVWRGQ